MNLRRAVSRILPVTLLTLPLVNCSGSPPDSPVLTAERPLHLEEQLELAMIEGSDVPDDVRQPVVWDFSEPQLEWKAVEPWEPEETRPELSRTEDALRIALGDADVTDEDEDMAWGAIYIAVPDWKRDDWAHIQVRARSDADVEWMGFILGFNLRDKSEMEEEEEEEDDPFEFFGETATVIRDSTIQTYNLRADWSGGQWEGPWKQLVLGFWADKEASIDILSVTVVPKEATYAG